MNAKSLTLIMSLVVVAAVAVACMPTTDAAEVTVSPTDDLSAKINGASPGDIVKLTGNYTLSSRLTVNAGVDVTLDLGGFTLSAASSFSGGLIYNNGTMTITNGSVTNIGSTGTNLIVNQGTMTIKDGTYSANPNSDPSKVNAVIANNGTTLTIESGTFQSSNIAVYTVKGTTNINGGNFSNAGSSGYVVLSSTTSGTVTTNISGGSFTSDATNVLRNDTNGNMTVTGGTFTSNSAATVNNAGTMTITVDETSIFTATASMVFQNDGKVTINGGKFSGSASYVFMNKGDMDITGGTFENVRQTSVEAYTFMNDASAATLDFKPAEGKSISVTSYFGCIYNAAGTVTIDGGEYTVKERTDGSQSYYAVLTRGADGAATTTINDGQFTSYNFHCIRVGVSDEVISTYPTTMKINGGTFEVTNGGSDIMALFYDPKDGVAYSTEVSGGTFSTPLPDTVTVPTGSLEGVNSQGETVVAEAVQVTVVNDGTSKSVSVAKGTCLPESELPTEQTGLTYTYTLGGTATTRDALLKTDLNGGESVAITSSAVPTDHTITFYVDGTLYATKTVAHGENLTDIPANPTKTGYDFAGWKVSGVDAVFTNVTSDFRVDAVFTNVTSDFRVDAAFTLKAPSNVTVELSGPLYEGGSITATVTAEHELEGVTFLYAMKEIEGSTTQFGESPTFTIDHAGEYAFAVGAIYNGDHSGSAATSETIEVTYSTHPSPGYDDDEDLPPFVPGQTQGSDDDSVTIVACAAAAVVAALMAVFLIVSYRKD